MRKNVDLAVMLLLLPALAIGQSLAEVARRERARQERNKKEAVEVRVITQEEVSGGVEAEETVDRRENDTALSSLDMEPKKSLRGEEPSSRREEEIGWRGRMSRALERLKLAQERYEWVNGLYIFEGAWYEDEKANKVITSLAQLRQMIQEAKAELDAATQALNDLKEEARRAGVPPGWLR